MASGTRAQVDVITILIYLALVAFGWVNIFSTTYDADSYTGLFDISRSYGKQFIFILVGLVLIALTLSVNTKSYERFSSIIYVISLLSLVGLFVAGKTISGATSWYAIGPFTLQPSEFAKVATGLALAKYLSDINVNLNNFRQFMMALAIIMIPALIIVPQPDPGSALVFVAFLFPLYREGMWFGVFGIGIAAVVLFIAAIVAPVSIVIGITAVLIFFVFWMLRRAAIKRRRKPIKWTNAILTVVVVALFASSVGYIFNNVFEDRHRNRFNIILGLAEDNQGIGYNLRQSEIAIGSGGWLGRGWLEGTQTQGDFVPEQYTDYIFSAVGEEWGFLGSAGVVILFAFLIIRLVIMAERQRGQFARVYIYSVASVFFLHVTINMGMVIGLLPTVGIPLPFFSYGGSGLWGFTLLLFIAVKLDSTRRNYTGTLV